ncbi:MAG: cell division ATP-binding protein FtsE [Erythrobacter sp.]
MNERAGDIVKFDSVGLRYGTDSEVLSDLSFTLYPGRFYFLTGASGAGKTSLLKLLYLAQRPSRGAITMFGEDMHALPRQALPDYRRRLGVVFQDFRLVPHLSAHENVSLPLRLAGTPEPRIEKAVSEMLDWVGLAKRMHAVPARMSGGEQQRVAIARAVISRPQILIADEPTGNVDPEMALKLLRLFEALNNRIGTTVVVATHDVHLLKKVPASLIMRLDKGRLSDPTGALRYPPRVTQTSSGKADRQREEPASFPGSVIGDAR